MTLENIIRAFAGAFVLVSLALTRWVDPRFVWATVFVGANLFQSAFTGFCPLAWILSKRRVGRRSQELSD